MYFVGNSIILNDEIAPLADQLPIGKNGEIYELFRVENGRPLFLADHIERFRASLDANDIVVNVDFDKLPAMIDWLIVCNSLKDNDIRMCVTFENDFQAGAVISEYPTEEMYREGVKCDFLSATRQNPNQKIYYSDMRKAAKKLQKKLDVYESLLVDHEDQITEGSRSNIFFIRDGELFTAPDDMVLGGIMRKKVLEIAEKRQIFVNFVPVKSTEIFKFQSAFLTSTPMRVLPIRKIGIVNYSVDNQILTEIIKDIQLQIKTQ